MADSRLAWLSVGASRTDIDSGSSASLLHSIYGSQLSQLPFSPSEACLAPTNGHAEPHQQRRALRRPKSSPAASYVARERQKDRAQRPASALRPPSVVRPVQRPGTARAGSGSWRRPPSAAAARQQRPSSAKPRVGGAGGARLLRPHSALGVRQAQPSMVVLDEEGEEVGVASLALCDKAAPVRLTQVPEYFDFWQGKPLSRRESGVRVHKRPQWHYAGGDYGNHMASHQGSGRGGGAGVGEGLEPLLEGGGEGGEGEGRGQRGSDVAGEGADGAGTGLGAGADGGSSGTGSGRGPGAGSDGEPGVGGRGSRGSGSGQSGRGAGLKDRPRVKHAWGTEDHSSEAEDDLYFKKKATGSSSWLETFGSGSTSRFELPMDLKTLEAMEPSHYLHRHCVVSNRRLSHCSGVFHRLDKDRATRLSREAAVCGLVEVLYGCITADQVGHVLDTLRLPGGRTIDLKLFAALSIFLERVLPAPALPFSGREVIEVADFEALEWRLRNCHISTALRHLFTRL